MHIHYFGHDILRKRCKKVERFDAELQKICRDMSALMDQSQGTGLAAPQIGLDMRIFVARLASTDDMSFESWLELPIDVFINPEITITNHDMEEDEEGCLSLPGLNAFIYRPLALKIKAQDVQGKFFTREYEGRLARIVLHENDHLNGVLYFDRLEPKEKKSFKQQLRKLQKEDPCYKNIGSS